MAELAILIPVLDRPQNAAPVAYSAHKVYDRSRVVFITDESDADERSAVQVITHNTRWASELAMPDGSTYAEKINHGIAMRQGITDYFFTAADDLEFKWGWFEAAVAKMTGPGGIGVVGTNDLANPRVIRGEHATHFLIADWYTKLGGIDGRPGIFHEGYSHQFVDNEVIAVAKHRNAYAHADDSHVAHRHPFFSPEIPMDDTYRKGLAPERFEKDRARFHAREHLWGAGP